MSQFVHMMPWQMEQIKSQRDSGFPVTAASLSRSCSLSIMTTEGSVTRSYTSIAVVDHPQNVIELTLPRAMLLLNRFSPLAEEMWLWQIFGCSFSQWNWGILTLGFDFPALTRLTLFSCSSGLSLNAFANVKLLTLILEILCIDIDSCILFLLFYGTVSFNYSISFNPVNKGDLLCEGSFCYLQNKRINLSLLSVFNCKSDYGLTSGDSHRFSTRTAF